MPLPCALVRFVDALDIFDEADDCVIIECEADIEADVIEDEE